MTARKAVAKKQPPQYTRAQLTPQTILCDTDGCLSFYPIGIGVTHAETWELAFRAGWTHDDASLRRCPQCSALLVGRWPWQQKKDLPFDCSLYDGDLDDLFIELDRVYGGRIIMSQDDGPDVTGPIVSYEPLPAADDPDAVIDAEVIEDAEVVDKEDEHFTEVMERLEGHWETDPDTSAKGFTAVTEAMLNEDGA